MLGHSISAFPIAGAFIAKIQNDNILGLKIYNRSGVISVGNFGKNSSEISVNRPLTSITPTRG